MPFKAPGRPVVARFFPSGVIPFIDPRSSILGAARGLKTPQAAPTTSRAPFVTSIFEKIREKRQKVGYRILRIWKLPLLRVFT